MKHFATAFIIVTVLLGTLSLARTHKFSQTRGNAVAADLDKSVSGKYETATFGLG